MVAGSGIHTRGRKSQRSRLASTSASTLSVLILASAMARVRSGLETTTSATKGCSRRTTAQVLVVASTAMWVPGGRCLRAKPVMASRVVEKWSRWRTLPVSSRTKASTIFLCKSSAANGIINSLLICGERAGSFSVQRERPPETRLPVTRYWMDRVGGRRRQGQNGTYLFELEVQPGGPEGRPDTTAGSQPIRIIGRPQGVRPCSPWMVGCSSHLVPSPVSNSRSQLARGWQVPAKQLPAGVYAMPRSYHARYDVLNHLIQVTMPRYNASSQITTTQTRTFNYTTSNQVGSLLLSATNPENGTVTYTYGANNLI